MSALVRVRLVRSRYDRSLLDACTENFFFVCEVFVVLRVVEHTHVFAGWTFASQLRSPFF